VTELDDAHDLIDWSRFEKNLNTSTTKHEENWHGIP
jgi:hypothetical protein